MNKLSRLTALLLALIMLLGNVSTAESGLPIGGTSGLTSDDWAGLVDDAEERLFFTDEGDTGKEIIPESPEQPERPAFYPYTAVEELILIQSETSAEAGIPASGAAILTHEAAGQWQIKVAGVWANLPGETGSTLTVNRAMMYGQNSVEVRKGLGKKNAETGEYAAYTQTAVLSVVENNSALFSVSRDTEGMAASDANQGIMTLEVANQENMVIVQVVYRIQNTEQPVADAYVGQIAKGSALNTKLTLPRVTGYMAAGYSVKPAELDITQIATFNAPTADTQGSLEIHVAKELTLEDITIYVEYAPAQVEYTIRHMQQNVDNDGYTEKETETLTGLTGDPVGETHENAYDGFSAIWYDPTTTIAADGSTVVEIYYNREYYLMTFELGGGYGVEPIFARYEAKLEVSKDEIKRPGYTFTGWTDEAGNAAEIPDTMPIGGGRYKATWTESETTFTVVYWRADLKDDKAETTYSYWGQKTVDSQSETVLIPSEVGEAHPAGSVGDTGLPEAGYFTYDAEVTAGSGNQDQAITVAGDGTTVVNVYYSRNSYTIRFIYAYKDQNDTYYVANNTYCGAYNGVHVSSGSGHTKIAWSNVGKDAPVVEAPYANQTGSEVDGNNTYYYIYLTAEYGANLESVWPAAPVAKTGNYYFGSWGAQCGSPYRIKYGNEHANIVGAYPIMSEDLIMDPADSIAQTMVAWWGQSSANIKSHTYHIYYEALPGKENDEGVRWIDDVPYARVADNYFTCAHNGTTRVDPFEYLGFECVNDTRDKEPDTQKDSNNYQKGKSDNKCPDGQCEYCNVFYYKRDRYKLSFYNYNDASQPEAPTSETVMFGESFSEYNPGVPEYPQDVEPGALRFVGWYTTPEAYVGTEVDWDSTMPAGALTFYAKWELETHNVQFWIDKDAVGTPDKDNLVIAYENIPHGKLITEAFSNAESYVDPDAWLEAHPNDSHTKYTFDGWYYDDNGMEKRFDITTMPIKSDMDIYAKWTSNTPVQFVFYFQHKDKKGTTEYLAPCFEGKALPGTPVTMSAKIGTELTGIPEGKDPLGYIPLVNSHTITLDVDESKNVFTFLYQEPAAIEYTVQYLLAEEKVIDGKVVLEPKEGVEPLATEKTVSTTKAVVTENYVPVKGHMPQATQLRLIVSMNAETNLLQFLYLPNTTDALYNATHIVIDHENKQWEYGKDENLRGIVGQMEEVNKREFVGYEFAYAQVAVPEKKGDEWVDVLYDVPKEQVTENQVQYVLPDVGMHLYLYYTPVACPFIVYHLDAQDESKTYSEPTEDTAPYGSVLITEQYIKAIPDYRFVRLDPAQKTVELDPDVDNPSVNVLKIYYEPDVTDLTISKTIAYSNAPNAPQPNDEQLDTTFTFNVQLNHPEKEQKDSYVTIDGERQALEVRDGELTLNLKRGQSATIHDLWGGTEYEVWEVEEQDFRTSYDTFHKGELSSMDVYTVVTNTFPKYVGELTVIKTDMQDQKESAIVKAVVGSEIYYLVLNGSNNYTATISGIKPNTEYTVTELTGWTWQYSAKIRGGDNGDGTGKITEESPTATVNITNTYDTDRWLHDESHVVNNFETGTKKDSYNN